VTRYSDGCPFQIEFAESAEDFAHLLRELAQWVSSDAPKPLQRAIHSFIVKWLNANAPGDYQE